MADTTNRNRVAKGVPTGGEFATEQRGENDDLEAAPSMRSRIKQALDANPKGTHRKTLLMCLGSYEALKDIPFFKDEIVDAVAEAEFVTQAKVEEAKGKCFGLWGSGDAHPKGETLTRFQDMLLRAHGATLQKHINQNNDDLKNGQIWGQVYFPRTGVSLPVPINPEDLEDPANTRPALAPYFDAAHDYDSVSGFVEWDSGQWRKGTYPETDAGEAQAKADFEKLGEAAGFLKAAVNSDYPMYVFGMEPEDD